MVSLNPRKEISEKTRESELVVGGKGIYGNVELRAVVNPFENSVSATERYRSESSLVSSGSRLFYYPKDGEFGMCVFESRVGTDASGRYWSMGFEIHCLTNNGFRKSVYSTERTDEPIKSYYEGGHSPEQ